MKLIVSDSWSWVHVLLQYWPFCRLGKAQACPSCPGWMWRSLAQVASQGRACRSNRAPNKGHPSRCPGWSAGGGLWPGMRKECGMCRTARPNIKWWIGNHPAQPCGRASFFCAWILVTLRTQWPFFYCHPQDKLYIFSSTTGNALRIDKWWCFFSCLTLSYCGCNEYWSL